MEKNYSDFRTWSSSHGHRNGTVEGGTVWFTTLPSGRGATVWTDENPGYTFVVYSGVPDSYTTYWEGRENVEIVYTCLFLSPTDFPVASEGFLV